MIGKALQLALRELQSNITAPRFWLAMLTAAIVLGLAGPFGTFGEMNVAARLAYWGSIAVGTYLIADGCVAFLTSLRQGEMRGGVLTFAGAGALSGVPVALYVWAVNLAALGRDVGVNLASLIAYCVPITAVVAAAVHSLVYNGPTEGDGPDADFSSAGRPGNAQAKGAMLDTAAQARPRILDRLPPQLRGQLFYLSMQDHYVDIRTDKGGALALLRLADAIAETEGVSGLQIHRSHWVARDAVKRAVRRDGKLALEMADGALLPVSRAMAQNVKAAGLV